MGVISDARTLMALARGAGGPGSHAERMARFYGPQARDYDRFRDRLLPGRRELIRALSVEPGARVVELGGGTGRNAEFFGPSLNELARLDIVDICAPLIDVARRRMARRTNVHCTVADATEWRPEEPVDAVYLSYALTMIPNWRGAIDNAVAMLRPGGLLGVVDFHVAPHHRRVERIFWPRWFAHDGVYLSEHYVPYLRWKTEEVLYDERRTRLPYLLGVTAPYYRYIGHTRS